MIPALLIALTLGQAEPAPAREPAPPVEPRSEQTGPLPPEPGERRPVRPEPVERRTNDPDEDVIRNLELLQDLELLEHADAFDPGSKD